eukprot:CAMPEP_0117438660 /NCGR_PEP_ID=MMETSP0759-20121206/2167_1 /TAXON_ID=63605 /ORGANISM="Percolomonas cosmopolitus, Strain WS" /LENGTH=783 /DNA_ID=CAMNT_0005230357 /DNA_START=10 /DNA_END=2361 /DNA_ORIENTATION=-
MTSNSPDIAQFKEYNELNNRIRDAIPSQLEKRLSKLSLPRIASCGSQSAGKSSILTQMTGIRFPRASGTCTRVPIELRLERSRTDDYSAKMRVKWCEEDVMEEKWTKAKDTVDNIGQILSDEICDSESLVMQVEIAIKAAQDAIMEVRPVNFSSSVITISASSPDLPNLTLVDLPGMVAYKASGENGHDVVENLYQPYLSDTSTVILAVLTGETDYENQPIWNEVNKHDPLHERTIGVITKADRIDPGGEKQWMDLISGDNIDMSLTHGWYVTKSLSQKDLESISQHDALLLEKRHFQSGVWKDFSKREKLGTENLRQKMTALLLERMKLSLPEVGIQVNEMLKEQKEILKGMGECIPESDEGKLSVLKEKIDILAQELHEQFGHLTSSQELSSETHYSKVKDLWAQYKKDIRSAGPEMTKSVVKEFKLWENVSPSAIGVAVRVPDNYTPDHVCLKLPDGTMIGSEEMLKFDEQESLMRLFRISSSQLSQGATFEENGSVVRIDPMFFVVEKPNNEYREKVKKVLRNAQSNYRIMIGERPSTLSFSLCDEFVKEWISPSHDLAQSLFETQQELVRRIVLGRFEQFTELKTASLQKMDEYLNQCQRGFTEYINMHHEAELKHKHTLNDHHFHDTKSKFNARNITDDDILQKVKNILENQNCTKEKCPRSLWELAKKDVSSEQNPFESDINDTIATVAAYVKCAHERFMESCCMISSKIFLEDFEMMVKKDLWIDVRKGRPLSLLFSEKPHIVNRRKTALASIVALEKIQAVLGGNILVTRIKQQ